MKGGNLRIEETKRELTSFINSHLQVLPIGVIKMILETSLVEVNNLYDKIVEKETSEYEESIKAKGNPIQNGTDSKEE